MAIQITFYIGTSFDLEDYKIPIINNMDSAYSITLVKRFSRAFPLVRAKQEWMHEDAAFKTRPSDEEMLKAEKDLGMPFGLLLRYWYNWDERIESDRKRMQDHYAAITQYINYWKSFFARNRTSVFVTTFESTFPEIVSVEVAWKMGIKVIFIYGGRMSGSLMLCDHSCAPLYWKKMAEKEKSEIYSKLRQDYLARNTAVNPQIAKEVGKYSDFSPTNVMYKMERLRSYMLNYYSMLEVDKMRTISPGKLVHKYLVGTGRQVYSGGMYGKADFKSLDYFFFPLQFLEETNASYPEAFLDQFQLIKDIAKSLPIGYKLLVKSHPHWKNRDIPVEKMRELRKIRNVVIVHPSTSPYELIKHSKAVFVISSTPGFEAMILGKPVVTFGHDALFADNDACTTIRDMSQLPAVMLDLASGRAGFNEEATKDIVARYYKHLMFLEGKFGMNKIDLTDADGKKIAGQIKEYLDWENGRKAK